MDEKLFRSIVKLFLIFTILALMVIKFDYVVKGGFKFILSIKPLLIAIVISYILRLFQKKIFRELLHLRKLKIFSKESLNQEKFENVCRVISILLTYVVVFGIAIALISIIIPQATNSLFKLSENFDAYKSNMQELIHFFEQASSDLNLNFEKLKENLNSIPDKIGDAFGNIVLQLYNFTFDIIGFIMTMVLGIILSVYMLAGADKISKGWNDFLNTYIHPDQRRGIIRILDTTDEVFSAFVVGQITEAIILGSLCFVGMLIFRFEYAPLISTLIGSLSIIPLIGAYAGAFIACLLLFIISPIKALWFLIFFVVLQQFEGNVIYPKVVGNSIGLPAMLVLIAILVGGSLFGIIGTVLSVPITAILYRLIKEDMEARKNLTK